jgi:hypothetical protein
MISLLSRESANSRFASGEPAAQQGLAADNRQLGVPDFGSILALGDRAIALTVSAVCCS